MTYQYPFVDMEIAPEDRRRVRIGRGMGITVSRLVGITGAPMVVVQLDEGLKVQTLEASLVYDDVGIPAAPVRPRLVCVDGVRVPPRAVTLRDTWGGGTTGGAA